MITPDPVEQVRGSDEDALWSARAGFALARAGVPRQAIDQELALVAQQMRDSGQGPRELHGSPGDFARDRARALAEEGMPLGYDGPQGAEPVDDASWLEQVRQELVLRGDLLPGQIDGRLREVQEHARQAGSTLWEEFGSPRSFVILLPLCLHRPRLRPVLLSTLLGTVCVAWALWSDNPWWLDLPLLAVWIVALAWRWFNYLRNLRRHRDSLREIPTHRMEGER